MPSNLPAASDVSVVEREAIKKPTRRAGLKVPALSEAAARTLVRLN